MLQFVPFAAGLIVGATALRWVQRKAAQRPAPPPEPAFTVTVTDGDAPAPAPAPGEAP